jgi:hypothetical protein
MTSSEQRPPRARQGPFWLVLFLAIAFGLYSASWYWLAGRVRDEAASTIAGLEVKGIQAECSNLTVSGYPLRFVVACDGLAYQDDSRNVAATSGRMDAVATLFSPLSPTLDLAGPLRTAAPGMTPLWLDWDRLRVDAGLSLPLPSKLRLSAEGLSGQTDPENGDPVSLFSVGRAETELRPDGEDLAYKGRFGALQIDPAAIGGRVLPAFDVSGEVTLKKGIALLRTGFRSLRDQAIEIRNLELISGEARLSLSGPLSVDSDGLIDARLNLRLTNPKAVAAILAGAIPEQKDKIDQGFSALAMLGSEPSMPLVVVKGKASLGFIPLGRIGAVGP